MKPALSDSTTHNTDPPPLRAAMLTPRGRGAVATVRIIGACDVLTDGTPPLFRSHAECPLSQRDCGRVVYGQWGDAVPEDVVVCRVDERITDLQCHGGDAAVERILDDLRSVGCIVQSWHDMTESSSDILEREFAESLSRAVTQRTAEILLEQKTGVLRDAFERLASLAVDRTLQELDELLRWSEFGRHLTEPWKVVIAGRPNAGKSSLINALVGYSRSVVYAEPGTTRDVVTAQTAFDGWPIELADTAGIRTSDDALEAEGIERAQRQIAAADCRILVLDLSRRRDSEEERLLADWPDAILVGHKWDLPNLWGRPLPADIQRVSSLAATGLDELAAALVRHLIPETPPPGIPIPLTARQTALLRSARAAVSTGDIKRGRATLLSLCDISELADSAATSDNR